MRNSKLLYYGQPISNSPLNHGLVSRWQIVPWYASGPRLIDLNNQVGGRNHGTLTNGPTWQGALGRPGGYGSLKFDGSDDYMTFGIPAVAIYSVAFWYLAPTSAASFPVPIVQGDDAFNNAVWDWGFYSSSTTNLVSFCTTTDSSWNTPINEGVWNHIVMIRKDADGNATSWVNGVKVATKFTVSGTVGNVYAVRTLSGAQRSTASYDQIQLFERDITAQVAALYEDSRRGSPETLNWLQDTSYFFGISASGDTYTGTSAVTVGAATASGSATFTKPTYTGTSAVSVGAATVSGSATFTKPTYTGSSTVSVGAATASGSATFTKPTYTGSATVSQGATTCSGSATFTKPTYTGTSTNTTGAATCSGTATFTKPTYTGTSAANVAPATCSGSATFTKPTYTGTSANTIGAATCSGTATFSNYLGTGACTVGAVTCSLSGTFAVATTSIGTSYRRHDLGRGFRRNDLGRGFDRNNVGRGYRGTR